MSEIASLQAEKVRIPFRRPFVTATGMWLEREAWILTLVSSAGGRGIGEAVLEPRDGETAHAVLDQLVRAAVEETAAGRLPDDQELERHGAPGRALAAALDAAAQDLRAVPPPRLRPGGSGVGANATIPSVGPSASAEAALQALEAGFGTLKLKVGAERETARLVERVRAVRGAVGPDVRIRLDANGAWDPETAIERLSAVGRFDIEFVEDPLVAGDAAELAMLRRRVGIPIAADEPVVSVGAARALIEVAAVDALVVKPSRVGGVARVLEIADAAAVRGVPVVLSTLFETGVGVAAALHAAARIEDLKAASEHAPPSLDHGLATTGLLEHDLLALGLVVEDGRIWLPETAAGLAGGGLGVALDAAAVRRYRVESVAPTGA